MEFPRSFSAGVDALHLSSAFTADEFEVAGILLDLAGKLDISSRLPPSWGAKRRRSVLDNPPPATGKSDYSSRSPNSPLDYISQVDSDSTRLPPATAQEKKDELLTDLGRLTETREYLELEVKRTKLSRDELMAENMKLQETEQLMHERASNGSDLELRLMSQAEPSAQPSVIPQSKVVGPKGIIIPDLNAPADEFLADVERPQPSDQSQLPTEAAARGGAEAAALARRHRRLIQMNKRARRGSR